MRRCEVWRLFLLLSLSLVASVARARGLFGRPHLRSASRPDPGRSLVSPLVYRTCYIDQKIDHFGFAEDRTFKQRYLIADQHWKSDVGSILFYTGNEGDITWFANNTGFMWNVAEELDALLVFAEHRYYGESLPFGNQSLAAVCKYLKNPKLPDKLLLQNVFQAVNLYFNYTQHTSCLNTTQSATKNLGLQGWYYQSCTEMVMPLCSDGINDMFEPQPWDLHAYSEECFKIWGVRPRPSWIPISYGGKNISAHSNIIFSNGGLDPWSGGGVMQNITDTLVAIVIPEGAHHLDLRSNSPFDPDSVLKARLLEVHFMRLWIQQHRKPKKRAK